MIGAAGHGAATDPPIKCFRYYVASHEYRI